MSANLDRLSGYASAGDVLAKYLRPWGCGFFVHLAKPPELPHLLRMADALENPNGGKIDNKALFLTLSEVRRDQREINELLIALTKHIFELEKRLTKRLDSAVAFRDMRRGGIIL